VIYEGALGVVCVVGPHRNILGLSVWLGAAPIPLLLSFLCYVTTLAGIFSEDFDVRCVMTGPAAEYSACFGLLRVVTWRAP
jgi:hypothetical protein